MTERAPIDDPKHWRERADEARAIAAHLMNPQTRLEMLEIAQIYERLAARAEARLAAESTRDQ